MAFVKILTMCSPAPRFVVALIPTIGAVGTLFTCRATDNAFSNIEKLKGHILVKIKGVNFSPYTAVINSL